MKTNSPFLTILAAALALSACQNLNFLSRSAAPSDQPKAVVAQQPQADTARPQSRPSGSIAGLGAGGLRPEALDRTSAQDRAAALAPGPATGAALGETLASLGSPAEPGLWLRTGLVTRAMPGRIVVQDGGAALRVELRPSGTPAGSGSQLSLAAFTTLGLPLTTLVRLQVFPE
jgi:hypothetical protein